MNSRKLLLRVLIVFCAINGVSYYLMPEGSTIDDGFVYFGWPFSVYAYGGFFHHGVIVWTGLIANVFVALGVHRVLRRPEFIRIATRIGWRFRGDAMKGEIKQ